MNRVKKNKTSSYRTNSDVHDAASAIYNKMGLTLSDAIHVFLVQSVQVGGFPFKLNDSLASDVKTKAKEKLKNEILKGLE